MRLLLLQARLADLSVRKHADDSAVLANAFKLAGSRLAAVLRGLLGVPRERLFLRAVPVLHPRKKYCK